MSHEFSSGSIVGRTGWHGLANEWSVPPSSVAEIVAGMGGNDPEKVQLPTFALDNGTIIDLSKWSAIVDPITGKVFQPAVSTDYQVVIRQQLAEIALALQDLTAEEFDTLARVTGTPPVQIQAAVQLRDGAIQAITASVGDDMVLADGTSHAGLYLVVRNSHDGTMALGGQLTSILAECMNTLTAGMRNAKSSFSIKHTKDMRTRIEDAKKLLGIASKYRESFASTAEVLVNTAMPRSTFEDMIRDVYPRKDKGQAPFSEEQYALLGVIDRSETINDAWRDTRWGGLNAVTEYETWLRERRNVTRSANERALESDLWGRGSKNGSAAFEWLTKDIDVKALVGASK